MTTKTQIIERARKMGSSATTFRGAVRFLRANLPSPRQLDHAGRRSVLYRTAEDRAKYDSIRSRARLDRFMTTRAEEYLSAGRFLQDRRKPVPLLDRDQYNSLAMEICKSLGLMTLDEAEALAESYDRQICEQVASQLAADWPFRKSTTGWAGGQHSVTVTLAQSASIAGGGVKVWSDNGKWSGSNSFATLQVTQRALDLFPTLRTADGSIIIDAEIIGPREYMIQWVAQGPGFNLRSESGFLIRGWHSTAKSILTARRNAKAARTRTAEGLLKQRARTKTIKQEWGSVFVSVDDSIAAGNCKPITEQFASKVYDLIGASGPCAVRADIVLALRDDHYVRRALAVAQCHGAAA